MGVGKISISHAGWTHHAIYTHFLILKLLNISTYLRYIYCCIALKEVQFHISRSGESLVYCRPRICHGAMLHMTASPVAVAEQLEVLMCPVKSDYAFPIIPELLLKLS